MSALPLGATGRSGRERSRFAREGVASHATEQPRRRVALCARSMRPIQTPLTSARDRGCRTNPGRARWIVSKGGLRKGPSPPPHAEGQSPRRPARQPWGVLPQAWSGLSEMALRDSLDEERVSELTPAALAVFVRRASLRSGVVGEDLIPP